MLRELTDGGLGSRVEGHHRASASLRRWLDAQPSSIVDAEAGVDDLHTARWGVAAWSNLPELRAGGPAVPVRASIDRGCCRYHNLRKVCRQMRNDTPAWDWRLSKEWNLVRVRARPGPNASVGSTKKRRDAVGAERERG